MIPSFLVFPFFGVVRRNVFLFGGGGEVFSSVSGRGYGRGWLSLLGIAGRQLRSHLSDMMFEKWEEEEDFNNDEPVPQLLPR